MGNTEIKHSYQVTIKATSPSSIIAHNGEIVDDREAYGIMLIAKTNTDEVMCGMVGSINPYTFGRALGKTLVREDMMDAFMIGLKESQLPDETSEMMRMLIEAFNEEESHG